MRKKILFILLILTTIATMYLYAFTYLRISNNPWKLPGTEVSVCNGYYIETYDESETDGGVGGWCIGSITKTLYR